MSFSRRNRKQEIIENQETEQYTKGVEYRIITAVAFLVAFGLIMVYSASSYRAISKSSCNYDAAFYLKKQAVYVVGGIVAALVAQIVPYSYKIYHNDRVRIPVGIISWCLSAVLVLLLLIDEIAITAGGATRWISVGPVQFQVADGVKIFMIIYMAWMLVKNKRNNAKMKTVFEVWGWVGIICGMLVVISSNLSSAIILALMAFVTTFVATRNYLPHLIGLVAGILVIFAIVSYCTATMPEDEDALNEVSIYQLRRIYAWLEPESFDDEQSYQTVQSLYAIGSGGLLGKGLGNSTQKLSNIPEGQNDMIFAIICEELGIFGALLMFSMFGYLLYQMYIIIRESRNLFGSLLVLGVMLHIGFQVIVNVAVSINAFPNTGVSLPFISYGGSAMVCTLAEIGMVIGVRKQQIRKYMIEQERQA